MGTENIIMIAGFATCFILGFLSFSFLVQKSAGSEISIKDSNIVFMIIWSFAALALGLSYYFMPVFNDFLNDIPAWNFALPFAGSLVLFALGFTSLKHYYTLLAAALLSVGFVLLTPDTAPLYLPHLPLWLHQIISVFILFSITATYRYLNGIDSFLGIQTLTLTIGIGCLSLFGIAPAFLGVFAIILTALFSAFLIFNWYPAQLNLKTSGCDALGFLIGCLVIYSGNEGTYPCLYIFGVFAILEVLWAIAKKLTFKPAYSNIAANTFYYQVNVSGLSPDVICGYYGKVGLIMILFGCFQAYSPNWYSLPLLCTIIVIWNVVRLKNWQEPVKSLKEINNEVYHNVKKQIKTIHSNFNKDDDETN